MQIKGVGVNNLGMLMGVQQEIPENGGQMQPEENLFGPEYEVTISEEGRALSEWQAGQMEAGVQGVQNDKTAEVMPGQLAEAQLDAKIRDGYWKELEDIEKQIKVLNAAYGRINEEIFKEAYKKSSMKKIIDQQKETVEQQRLLQEGMHKQEDFQTEDGLKRLREALQLADMRSARYKGEIDENNRDLAALLRTMEEARKAEEELEEGESKDNNDGASGTGNSASDAIRNSVAGFMKASLNREKNVEELSDLVGDSGHFFLSEADAVAQKLLKKSVSIKAAVEDKSFTIGQIDEMMQSFRSEVKAKSEEAYILGSFGTQVLRDMRDAKIQRIAEDPLQSMQQIKKGMMQAAADAALKEAGHSSLDETSKKLADEVERLIDERNHVDRISQDGEDAEAKQNRMPEEQEE